jgi:hypothetical protein
MQGHVVGIVGRVGRATARDAFCRGFDPCRQRPRGVAVDFGPKQSGWLINQLGVPQFVGRNILHGPALGAGS